MSVFDGFVVISEPLRQYISDRMNRHSQVLKLPIIIDTKEPFEELSEEIPPHPYIIHTGALSQQKDGIIDVFKAFAFVNTQMGNNLHFYIAGSKDAPPGVKEEIDKVVDSHGLRDNIHFLGLIFGDKLKTLQKNCLFLVLPKPDNEQNRNNFPTKLGEYLALSRPVITTRVGDMALFLKDGDNALLVDHGNVEQISTAMLHLIDDSQLSKQIGEGGRGWQNVHLTTQFLANNWRISYIN
jgi:glycosyltransferase involved in cell wall biosynthesis